MCRPVPGLRSSLSSFPNFAPVSDGAQLWPAAARPRRSSPARPGSHRGHTLSTCSRRTQKHRLISWPNDLGYVRPRASSHAVVRRARNGRMDRDHALFDEPAPAPCIRAVPSRLIASGRRYAGPTAVLVRAGLGLRALSHAVGARSSTGSHRGRGPAGWSYEFTAPRLDRDKYMIQTNI